MKETSMYAFLLALDIHTVFTDATHQQDVTAAFKTECCVTGKYVLKVFLKKRSV